VSGRLADQIIGAFAAKLRLALHDLGRAPVVKQEEHTFASLVDQRRAQRKLPQDWRGGEDQATPACPSVADAPPLAALDVAFVHQMSSETLIVNAAPSQQNTKAARRELAPDLVVRAKMDLVERPEESDRDISVREKAVVEKGDPSYGSTGRLVVTSASVVTHFGRDDIARAPASSEQVGAMNLVKDESGNAPADVARAPLAAPIGVQPKRHMVIELESEAMGTLRIRMAMSDQSMRVELESPHSETRLDLERSKLDLESIIAGAGVACEEIHVVATSPPDATTAASDGGRGAHGSSRFESNARSGGGGRGSNDLCRGERDGEEPASASNARSGLVL
jgi:hypothetical protein